MKKVFRVEMDDLEGRGWLVVGPKYRVKYATKSEAVASCGARNIAYSDGYEAGFSKAKSLPPDRPLLEVVRSWEGLVNAMCAIGSMHYGEEISARWHIKQLRARLLQLYAVAEAAMAFRKARTWPGRIPEEQVLEEAVDALYRHSEDLSWLPRAEGECKEADCGS